MTINLEQLRLALLWKKDTVFYGYLASTIPASVTKAIPTAACLSKDDTGTSVSIVFNSEFMDNLNLAQRKWVYIHEISHWFSQHFLRRNGREKELWNIACDLAINDSLLRDSHRMDYGTIEIYPDAWVFTSELDKLLPIEKRSAEEIYAVLNDDRDLLERVKGDGESPNHSGWADIENLPAGYVTATIADAIDSACQSAGTMPGTAQLVLKDILSPKVNWRIVLRHILGIGRPCGTERSWSRLDRRFDGEMPGRKKLRRGAIISIIDSSGSMTEADLKQIRSELEYQFKLNDVTAIVCDTEVHEIVKYKRRMNFTISGRGGTDMNPALEATKSMRRYNTIVIFTDGYLVAPPIHTSAKQIWVLTPGGSDKLLQGRTVVRMMR